MLRHSFKMATVLLVAAPAISAVFAAERSEPAGRLIKAASCSQHDVQAAIDAASDGDTVLVPAGTAAWTSPDENAPAVLIAKKAITVQGAGMDKTIITDATGAKAHQVPFRIIAAQGKPFRITGFAFEEHLRNTEETYELRVVFGTDNSEGLALSQGDRAMPQPLAKVIVHSIDHEITWPFGRGSLDGEPVP